MLKESDMPIDYEGHSYKHTQLMALMRAMAAEGWTLTLRCEGDPRRPLFRLSPDT